MSTFNLPSGMQVIERGWLSANMILLTGRYNSAVIDSGYWTHSLQTQALVKGLLAGQSLELLLNTHLHSDHCGGNAALQSQFPHLQTFIPPGQAQLVTAWDSDGLGYGPTGQHCPPFTFQGMLVPGAEILLGDHAWEIHAAQGHDPHSVILFQRETRTLISADALWENGFGVVFPELEGLNAFDAVGETLALIERLNPLTVVPGHGPVFCYSELVLKRAHSRLSSFVADPVRHAKHAAKVLLKFKLLELQSVDMTQFMAWALATPYIEMVSARFFKHIEKNVWLTGLINELVLTDTARYDENNLLNS